MSASAPNNVAWRGITLRVARVTQICLYDHAGRGGSDPAPAGPRSSDDIVADLHTALAKAGISPPYVLAGHSIGGIFALDFARLHPSEIAGMVLIDSSHPDQIAAWRRASGIPDTVRMVRGR